MNKKTKVKVPGSTIALNRKARHEYTIEKKYETGMVLTGWEVKSLRAGKVQIADSYVIIKKGEAWLLGSIITPLNTASTHVIAEPSRTRKLLLHQSELNTLIGLIERSGYTLIPTCMYWHKNKVKLEIGLAKGKKSYDKRDDEKARDWQKEKARIMKKSVQ